MRNYTDQNDIIIYYGERLFKLVFKNFYTDVRRLNIFRPTTVYFKVLLLDIWSDSFHFP